MEIIIIVIIILIINSHKKQKIYQNNLNEYRALTNIYNPRIDPGANGEFKTFITLKDLPGYNKILINCYIPKKNNNTTEIDIIIINETGIFVIESKNYKGYISGSESSTFWYQSLYTNSGRKSFRLYNPLLQNKNHMIHLEEYLNKLGNFPYFSYIVMGDNAKLNIYTNYYTENIGNRYQIRNQILQKINTLPKKLDINTINKIYYELEPLTHKSSYEKNIHIQNIKYHH